MIKRTFKQLGIAYGAEPLAITAKINNIVVYKGTVPTITDRFSPGTGLSEPAEQLFTWFEDLDFSGTVDMSFTIADTGCLFLANTLANYIQVKNPDTGPGQLYYINGGPDVFGYFYQKQMTDYVLGDPMSDIEINGVPQTTNYTAATSGQSRWLIEAGGTFSAKINILPGDYPVSAEPV
jgi:hypothetical protein